MTHEHGRVLPAEGPKRQGAAMDQQPGNIIVIAASAGGVQALRRLVSQLPADLGASVFVVVHIGPNRPSLLPHILSQAGPLPAYHPVHGQAIEQGRIYVAPPDLHMRLHPGPFTSIGDPRSGTRARPRTRCSSQRPKPMVREPSGSC